MSTVVIDLTRYEPDPRQVAWSLGRLTDGQVAKVAALLVLRGAR